MSLADIDGDLPPENETDDQAEARARVMGWKPLAEYNGPPSRWTDARTFLHRGETELPILRDQNRRMSEKLVHQGNEMAAIKRTVSEQQDAVKAAMDLARKAGQRGYDRAVAELKQKQRAAASEGDVTTFDQVTEEIQAMETARAEDDTPQPPPRRDEAPQPDPETTAFIAANAWFREDAFLRARMIEMHQSEVARFPAKPLAQQYADALGRLKRTYPDQFDEAPPVRRAAAAAEEPALEEEEDEEPAPRPRARSSGSSGGMAAVRRPASGSAIDRIPDATERAQARAGFDSIKRSDPNFTEDEYMAMLDDPHADVLALRHKRK